MTSVAAAIQLITQQARTFGTEEVPIEDASGRVLAQDIVAERDYPPFNRSAMDGYAVQAADFIGRKEVRLQLLEKLHAGKVATQEVTAGTCIKIMTGAPVPQGADAVVKVEDTREEGETVFFNTESIQSGQHIAKQGEDARQGDRVVSQGQLIDTPLSSVLAVTGTYRVKAEKLPTVAIISTGNEIMPVHADLLPHQIRDSNSYAVGSFFRKFGIVKITKALVRDDKESLRETIDRLLENDMLVLSGGVSKGEADYVPEVLKSLGVKEVFHRVRIKPGAPLWFGISDRGGVVFGLPGNPVSVQVACRIFIESYLRRCFGLEPVQPIYLPFKASRPRKTTLDEFFPGKILTEAYHSGLVPVRYNGSGDIAATLGSDGICLHPGGVEQLTEGMPVAFYPW